MSWRMTIVCRLCGDAEHRVYDDGEEPTGHACRASTVGEGLVAL